MLKIVFVCLGNICRSPMAEGLMKKKVNELGLDHHFHIESRGTSSWELGNPPHPKTQQILKRVGVNLEFKHAQKISYDDMLSFDVVIAMDFENVKDLKQMFPILSSKVVLLRSINLTETKLEVEDPYYTLKYEEVYQILDRDLDLWIEKFRSELNI